MEKLQGGIGQTKVRRYWPGKAPRWAEEVDVFHRSHDDDDSGGLLANKKKEPRLHLLSQHSKADHRRVRAISTEEEPRNRDEEEDEDAMEDRRRRIRENYLKRVKEEVDLLPIEEEEKEEEEEGSGYETDSEDDEMIGITMIKPVFVPKPERDTVAERERLEAKEEALEESAKRNLEIRKIETKQIVVEEVRKNMLLKESDIGDVEEIDDDDEINEAEEYEVWKTREIARMNKSDREETDKSMNMTEQESKNKTHSSLAKPKKKWKFMQRYYHKGAFFQEIRSVGDFSAPTGEDKLDKSKLRKVMQVKNFGRRGRSKWTHLVNEDTTFGKKPELADIDAPSALTLLYSLHKRYNKKMADVEATNAKPLKRKKMNDFKT